MRKFAVFDIDGTLIRWQLYHAVVDKLAKAGQLGSDAQKTLREARMRWKRREPDYSFRDYEVALIQTYEQSVTHLDVAEFEAAMNQVATEYKDQVYTYTRGLIASLKEKDYTLLAISGSHEELVAEVARHYGFDDWAGTRYTRSGNTFSGQKFIASQHKAAVLQKLIEKHRLTPKDSYAIGDSKSDIPMLEMVEHPIAFNPDCDLYAAATSQRWPLVIERKNVVYSLAPDNTGGYHLTGQTP